MYVHTCTHTYLCTYTQMHAWQHPKHNWTASMLSCTDTAKHCCNTRQQHNAQTHCNTTLSCTDTRTWVNTKNRPSKFTCQRCGCGGERLRMSWINAMQHHYYNTLLKHTTATYCCNTLLQHNAQTHYNTTLITHALQCVVVCCSVLRCVAV